MYLEAPYAFNDICWLLIKKEEDYDEWSPNACSFYVLIVQHFELNFLPLWTFWREHVLFTVSMKLDMTRWNCGYRESETLIDLEGGWERTRQWAKIWGFWRICTFIFLLLVNLVQGGESLFHFQLLLIIDSCPCVFVSVFWYLNVKAHVQYLYIIPKAFLMIRYSIELGTDLAINCWLVIVYSTWLYEAILMHPRI